MTELPILMQPEMAASTYKGIKTETRRTRGLKEINADIAAHEREEHPSEFTWVLECADTDPELIKSYDRFGEPKLKKGNGFYATFHWTGYGDVWRTIKCPYGKPGDILWVRETWSTPQLHDGGEPDFVYRADGKYGRWGDCGWHPSIHMPKKAARIWLKVKEIRIERLRMITAEGAVAEGIEPLLQSGMQLITNGPLFRNYSKKPELFNEGLKPLESFRTLWFKVNGEESWNENPYVWVVKFEVLSKNGRPACVSQGT